MNWTRFYSLSGIMKNFTDGCSSDASFFLFDE